jgi:hypothetical protein
MWRQPSPEALHLRRTIRQQIERLLRAIYRRVLAEGTPQRFVGLVNEVKFTEQNSSEVISPEAQKTRPGH